MNAINDLRDKSHCILNKLLGAEKGETDVNNTVWSFSVQHTTIMFPAFKKALDTIALAHKRSLLAGTARGVLITGQSGSGKTTLLKQYCAKFPAQETTERRLVPALYVPTPSRPSVKFLAAAVLIAMEAPFANESGEGATDRIIELLQQCGTQLLCIDEIHHLVTALDKREFARATEWLKTVINRSKIPVILAGMPKAVQLIQSNGQLRRRFSTQIYLRPFGIHSHALACEFRGLLKGLQKTLPLPCTNLADNELSARLFFATNGIIDYLAHILDGAIVECLNSSKSEITITELAIAFRKNIWSEVPSELNPFLAPLELLRPLDKWGEPFAEWDDPENYTRRLTKSAKNRGGDR